MPLWFHVILFLFIGFIFFLVYLLHKQSAEMSLFSLVILYIILYVTAIFSIAFSIGGFLYKNPPQIYMVLFLVALVGIPVHFIVTVIDRRRKRKGATYIILEKDCVTGIGEIVQDGSGFGGVSFGSGGVRPMIGGTPTKSKLRGFKVPYSNIISVDLLVQESGIVLMTQVANYICYIDHAQAVQDAIVKRMG